MGIFSNYCGPGGSGEPQHAVDMLCQKHDKEYQQMIDMGIDPYWAYSQADRNFLRDLKHLESYGTIREGTVGEVSKIFVHIKALMREAQNPGAKALELHNGPVQEVPSLRGHRTIAPISEIEITSTGESRKRPVEDGETASTPSLRRQRIGETVPSFNQPPTPTPAQPAPTQLPAGIVPTSSVAAMAGGRANPDETHGSSGETAVTIATPSYGLPDTHTTILHFKMYFSISNDNFSTPTVLQFRMNSIYDMCTTSLTTLNTSAYVVGVHPESIMGAARAGTATVGTAFPAVTAASTVATEGGTYRNWFTSQYDYWTVLGTEWKLKTRGTNAYSGGSRWIEMYTGSEQPPQTAYKDVQFWKNKKEHIISSGYASDQMGTYSVMSGTWKPGQHKREVRDDDKAKIWRPTDGAVPTLREDLTFFMYPDPLCGYLITENSQNKLPWYNCEFSMSQIVQFKDLKAALQYPYGTGSTIALNEDDIQMDV